MKNIKGKRRTNRRPTGARLLLLVLSASVFLPLAALPAFCDDWDTGEIGQMGAEASPDWPEDAWNVSVEDGADLLTEDEEAALTDQLAGYDSVRNYLVVTESDYQYSTDIHEEMDSLYYEQFGDTDGVAFLINMSDRELYAGGFGKCRSEFSSGDARDVTDNVYRYASDGDYYKCLSEAFSQINRVLQHDFLLRPMRYITAILLGLILGFFSMFVVCAVSRWFAGLESASPDDLDPDNARFDIVNGTFYPLILNEVVHQTGSHSSFNDGGGDSFSGGSSSGGGGSSGGGHGF